MYDKSVYNCIIALDSDIKTGLSSEQVELSRQRNGANIIAKGKSKSLASRFFAQFADLMIVILIAAAVLSLVLAIIEGEKNSFFEPIIIIAIILANAALGTVQQYKADRALEKLNKIAVGNVLVLRDKQTQQIPVADIVVGDIILLEAGNVVPCDCRLIEDASLKLNESMLTGESVARDKYANKVLPSSTALAERVNMIYSGTYVVSGRCRGVAVAVGASTEMGSIAKMLDTNSVKTPLENRLSQLSKVIGIVCLLVCALVFAIGLVKGIRAMGSDDNLVDVFMTIFMTSVSLAVAAIPEGLPAVVTVVLAKGVSRMASRNAIIKSLSAVETLGSASVICSDKTGTLTVGKMSLVSIVIANKTYQIDRLDSQARQLLAYSAMCCDVVYNDSQYFGDPTEVALVECCRINNIDYRARRVYEIPFDSTRKMMTVVVFVGGSYYAVTKGAFDKMTKDGALSRQYKELAAKGLRVLALSVKKIGSNYPTGKILESSLDVVALLAMSDTVKKEAVSSVAQCKQAGIKPVMITGDSLITAVEIARELGIYSSGDMAIEGSQLTEMSTKQLADIVDKVSVYARVTPADKLKIVTAFQTRGYVTAMTGDGVNDAPALKRADIGCAMGISGTDVAKEASDMILTDDNFATIVDAVAEGRTVYDNIKKSVLYLLSCNIGEVLCVLASLIIWNVTPLFAMQLLWVNLVTDGLPSLALGVDVRGRDVMRKPPKAGNDTFFSNGQGVKIAVFGVIFGIVSVVAYAIGLTVDSITANTMAFLVLSLSQLIFALEARSNRSIFVSGCSRVMILAFSVSVLLVAVAALTPSIMALFGLVYLSATHYLWAIALACVPLIVGELLHMTKAIKCKYC